MENFEKWEILTTSQVCFFYLKEQPSISCGHGENRKNKCLKKHCPIAYRPPNKEIADRQATTWRCKECGSYTSVKNNICIGCKTPATEF